MTPSLSPQTLWTRTGRIIAKGLSQILRPESAHCFKISPQTIYIPTLPEAFEGFRIVQISDIHFYEFSCSRYYQSVIDTVNGLQPDLIVTTGDIIHYGQHYLPLGESFLKQLSAPLGKWACMGNHDYSDDYRGQALQAMKRSAGFEVLVNEAITIEKEGKRLWLSGIDDFKMSAPDPEKAFSRIEKDEAHVSLLHNPAYMPKLVQRDKVPDLVLSGHTHGGHIKHAMVNWLQKHFFHHPYQYGWFHLGRTNLYVTSGIGSASVAIHMPHFDFALYPFRINTMPEIALFELTSQPIQTCFEDEMPASMALALS